MLYRYCLENLCSSPQYRKYSEEIPFFHNRPKKLITKIMEKIQILKEEGLPKIISITDRKYSVKSCSSNIYTVLLGNAIDLPTCTCVDFLSSKMLCKHICAVVICCNLSWKSLGKRFCEHPFNVLDEHVFSPGELTISIENSLLPVENNVISLVEDDAGLATPITFNPTSQNNTINPQLDDQEKFNSIQRNVCIQKAKMLLNRIHCSPDNANFIDLSNWFDEAFKWLDTKIPVCNNISIRKSSPIRKKRKRAMRSCKTLPFHIRNKDSRFRKVVDLKKGTTFSEMF